MSRWGVGPVFAFLSSLYGTTTIFITYFFHPFFKIGIISETVLMIVGIGL
jgi:hypothetical protein